MSKGLFDDGLFDGRLLYDLYDMIRELTEKIGELPNRFYRKFLIVERFLYGPSGEKRKEGSVREDLITRDNLERVLSLRGVKKADIKLRQGAGRGFPFYFSDSVRNVSGQELLSTLQRYVGGRSYAAAVERDIFGREIMTLVKAPPFPLMRTRDITLKYRPEI